LHLEPRHAALECPPDHPVALWLRAYFTGHVLPLPAMAPPHTPFQARLRQTLLAIPRGETKTYGELAGMLHSSPRAVGQALGANPLPILIPCHRVVAAGGLGGFGGGLEWKQHLLNLESVRPYR
jgi:methylated-DNA-[protein]-cysteine S-methyltransferase